MDKQAWCIKGPDGEIVSPLLLGEILQRVGYRAVPVTVSEQNAAQGMESVSAYQRQNDAEHSPAAAPPCQDAPAAATAKQQYEQFTVDGEDADPIERLRFFCSLAMKEQDWLDVEPFFDALSPPAEARKLADDFNRALNSYGFADMYLARKIVSALRGGRIDAHLSGKERTK